MAFLSAGDILRVWEAAAAQPPLERPLAILSAASDLSHEELARLPIGDRDARLLAVREGTFGREATGAASCARCGERIEFTVDVRALRAGPAAGGEGTLEAEGWSLRFRAPNSDDLQMAVQAADPRRALAARCLLEARQDGAAVACPQLPDPVIAHLAATMAESDPQAEVLLDHVCPACGEAGQTVFDIATFLWEELRAQAQRLLMEVASLARAYGWREADILAMSPLRRRAYLELAP